MAQPTDDKVKKIYTALSQGGNNLGTEEQFRAALADEGKRKKIFDALSAKNNLGTYEQFSGAVSSIPSPKQVPQQTMKVPSPSIMQGIQQGMSGAGELIPSQIPISPETSTSQLVGSTSESVISPLVTTKPEETTTNWFDLNKYKSTPAQKRDEAIMNRVATTGMSPGLSLSDAEKVGYTAQRQQDLEEELADITKYKFDPELGVVPIYGREGVFGDVKEAPEKDFKSGIDWLDKAIKQRKSDDIAMQKRISSSTIDEETQEGVYTEVPDWEAKGIIKNKYGFMANKKIKGEKYYEAPSSNTYDESLSFKSKGNTEDYLPLARGIDFWSETRKIGSQQGYIDKTFSVLGTNVLRGNSLPQEMSKVFSDYETQLKRNDPNTYKDIVAISNLSGKSFDLYDVYYYDNRANGWRVNPEFQSVKNLIQTDPNKAVSGRDKKIVIGVPSEDAQIGYIQKALEHQDKLINADFNARTNNGKINPKYEDGSTALSRYKDAKRELKRISNQITGNSAYFEKIDANQRQYEKALEEQKMADETYEQFYKEMPVMASIYYNVSDPLLRTATSIPRKLFAIPSALGIDLPEFESKVQEGREFEKNISGLKPTELQKSIFERPLNIIPNAVQMIADIYLMGAGGRVLEGLGMATRPAMFTSAYLNSYSDIEQSTYDQLKAAGLSESKAKEASHWNGVFGGLFGAGFESISPGMERLIAGAAKKEVTEELIKGLAKGESIMDVFGRVGKSYLKELPKEQAEELLTMFSEKMLNAKTNYDLGGDYLDADIHAEEIGETMIMTAIPGAFAEMRNFKTPNGIQRAALFEALSDEKNFIKSMNSALEKGMITDEQAKEMIKDIEELKSVVKGTPELDIKSEKGMDLIMNLYKKKKIKEADKGVYVDEKFAAAKEQKTNEKLAEIDAEIDDIIATTEEPKEGKRRETSFVDTETGEAGFRTGEEAATKFTTQETEAGGERKVKQAMVRSINELKAEIELMKQGKKNPETDAKIAEFEKEIALQEKMGISPDKGRLEDVEEVDAEQEIPLTDVKKYETPSANYEASLTETKNKGQKLDEKSDENISGVKVISVNDREGRMVVEVEYPNGETQLFYKSMSGTSGKGQGEWYPLSGFTSDAGQGVPEGWFIKDKGVYDRYGSKTFQGTSDFLSATEENNFQREQSTPQAEVKAEIKTPQITITNNPNKEREFKLDDKFYSEKEFTQALDKPEIVKSINDGTMVVSVNNPSPEIQTKLETLKTKPNVKEQTKTSQEAGKEGILTTPSAETKTVKIEDLGKESQADFSKGIVVTGFHATPTGEIETGKELGIHIGTEQASSEKQAGRNDDKGKVESVSVTVKNPLEMRDMDGGWSFMETARALLDKNNLGITKEWVKEIRDNESLTEKERQQKLIDKIKEAGYDGIIYKNEVEDKGKMSVIAFDKSQIKTEPNAKTVRSDERQIPEGRTLEETGADKSSQDLQQPASEKPSDKKEQVEADIEKESQEEKDKITPTPPETVFTNPKTPQEKAEAKKEEEKTISEKTKEFNKELTELSDPKFLNSKDRKGEYSNKYNNLEKKLPDGYRLFTVDGKVVIEKENRNKTTLDTNSIHQQPAAYKVGEKVIINNGKNKTGSVITKVDKNGKILEAKETYDDEKTGAIIEKPGGDQLVYNGVILSEKQKQQHKEIDNKANAKKIDLENKIKAEEKAKDLAAGITPLSNEESTTKALTEVAKDSPRKMAELSKLETDNRESLNNEISQAEQELEALVEGKNEVNESMPEAIVLANLPKINYNSALRETTGSRTRSGNDISPSLVSKTGGLSVEGAAEYIWEDHFSERNDVDVQDIRNMIIDILLQGKDAYKRSLVNQNDISDLKKTIKDKKAQITPEYISYAYHKAKKNNNNPDLVKAVEELLTPKPEKKTAEKKAAEKKIKQATKTIADKIRGLKTVKNIDDAFGGFQSGNLLTVFKDGLLEIIASTIEAGGSVAQAVANAMDYMKDSEWYKAINEESQAKAEASLPKIIEDIYNEYDKKQKQETGDEDGKQRKFAGQVINDSEIRPEVKDAMKEKEYESIPNDVTIAEADQFIKDNSVEEVSEAILDMDNNMSFRVRAVVGMQLIKQLNDKAQKEKDPDKKNEYYDKAAEIADALAKKGTEMGQGIQAFSLWSATTVEGMMRTSQRAVNGSKKKVDKETKATRSAVKKNYNKAVKKSADEAVKNATQKATSKTKTFGMTRDEIKKKKEDALKKFKDATKGKSLTSGGLNKEAIEAAGEYGYYLFVDGVRKFKDWVSSMKKATGLDNNALTDIWNGQVVNNGKTLAQLSTANDLSDIVFTHYTNPGKTTLAEKVQKELGLDEKEANVIAKEIETEYEKISKKEIAKQIGKNLPPGTRRTRKAINKLKKSEEPLTDEVIKEAFYDSYGIKDAKDIPAETMDEIMELDKQRQAAPQNSFLRNNITVQMLGKMNQASGIPWSDVVWGMWYANVLSGQETQILNMTSNAQNLLLELGVSAIEQAIIQRDPRSVWEGFKSIISGLTKGLTEAQAIFSEGVSAANADAMNLEAKPALENVKIGKYHKYVPRFMAAIDAIGYTASQNMMAYEVARDMAKEEGLTGEELNERANELAGNDQQSFDDASVQAQSDVDAVYDAQGKKKEGYAYRRDIRRRRNEILFQSMPADVQEKSMNFGRFTTYNYTPKGWIGAVAQTLTGLNRLIPPFRLVVPFIRVVANVLNQQLDYSPYGYLRGAGWNASSWTEKLGAGTSTRQNETSKERNREYVKATIGTALMVSAYMLASMGDDEEDPEFEITGKGPADFNKKNQLIAQGWKPYSVKVGNKYISYQYSPIGLTLSFIGNWRDNEKYKDLASKDFLTKSVYALKSSASGIMDMSFLTGMSGFMEALTSSADPEKAVENFMKSTVRTATSFVIPNLFKQSDNIYRDNTVYNTTDLTSYILADIPVVRSFSGLKPKLNSLGEPIQKDASTFRRFISTKNESQAWKLLSDKRIFIPGSKPGTKDFKGVAMSDDEYYTFIQKSGKGIKEFLIENEEKIREMDNSEAQKYVSKKVAKIRKRTKIQMYKEQNSEDSQDFDFDIE